MTFARLFYPDKCHQNLKSNLVKKQQRSSVRKKFKTSPRTRQDPIHFHNRKLAELKAKGRDEHEFLLETAHALRAYMESSNALDRHTASTLYFEKASSNTAMDFTVPHLDKNNKEDIAEEIVSTCPECDVILIEEQDFCSECGTQLNKHPQIVIGYNERRDYVTSEGFNYDEIKSVNEFLRELQGIQKANIPEDVCEQMRLVFSHYVDQKPDRTLESMTAIDLYECLKQEKKYSTYYRYIPTLLSRFTGRQKRALNSHTLAEIQRIAIQVVSVYKQARDNVCPHRAAFFNTKYLAYRLLEKVGEHHLLPFIRQIKCPVKLKVQDDLWTEVMRLLPNI